MSQVVFKTNKGLEIVGGYDHVDREFFLYVFDARPERHYNVVWSNLVDFDPIDERSTERLRRKLTLQGLTPPGGFWELVELRESDSVRHEWDGSRWQGRRFRESHPLRDNFAFA